jgi:hypothetical protein
LVLVGFVVLVALSEQVWRDDFKDSSGRFEETNSKTAVAKPSAV